MEKHMHVFVWGGIKSFEMLTSHWLLEFQCPLNIPHIQRNISPKKVLRDNEDVAATKKSEGKGKKKTCV